MNRCTPQTHEALKAQPYRFVIELDQIGELDCGEDGVLILANCKHCRSTLALEVQP